MVVSLYNNDDDDDVDDDDIKDDIKEANELGFILEVDLFALSFLFDNVFDMHKLRI